jgi:hypothetical protein
MEKLYDEIEAMSPVRCRESSFIPFPKPPLIALILRYRKLHRHHQAGVHILRFQAPVMQVHRALGDRQTKPHATTGTVPIAIYAEERLKNIV